MTPLKATKVKLTDTELVTQHIQNLEPALAHVVETLRQIILGAHEQVSEHIKWNNPCFYYTGAMQPFDPKEYKREIAVFNLYKGRIMLVFPSGAKVNDPSEILEGNFNDGRRTVTFKDLADVIAKKTALEHIIREWIQQVDN